MSIEATGRLSAVVLLIGLIGGDILVALAIREAITAHVLDWVGGTFVALAVAMLISCHVWILLVMRDERRQTNRRTRGQA